MLLVKAVNARPGRLDTYNFEVEETHTYFVGELGALAHNQCSTNNGMPNGVTFGRNANQEHHTWRHVEKELGMDRTMVQNAIVADMPPISSIPTGLNVRYVTVDGIKLQYNFYKFPDGTVNIGRIHAAN